MPALYALAQHDSLVAADGELLPRERILSFLDDLYVVTCRARACEACTTVTEAVERGAGVRTHLGKLRAWCAGGGAAPADLAALAPDAWTADKPDEQNGIKVLGTPFGRPAYVEWFAEQRMLKEVRLLDEIEQLSDPQCAWVMLSMSAAPRANHMIRMLPPSQSAGYAAAHDAALWDTLCEVLEVGQRQHHDELARDIATLPARLGGLGLRSAARSAPGAFLASCFDTLPVVQSKLPELAATMSRSLQHGPARGALAEAEAA